MQVADSAEQELLEASSHIDIEGGGWDNWGGMPNQGRKSVRNLVIVLSLSLLAGIVVPAAAQELLTNGDFEQDLSVGWKDSAFDLAGSHFYERSDTLGQSAGFGARAYKYLASYAALTQQVDVPSTNLVLSFDGRFRIGGGSSTCWPVAGVVLRYLNGAGLELGNTKFVLHNEFCTWANSDTAHLIEIEVPETWGPRELDIAQELAANLPGVNPADVSQVRIELYAYDNGT